MVTLHDRPAAVIARCKNPQAIAKPSSSTYCDAQPKNEFAERRWYRLKSGIRDSIPATEGQQNQLHAGDFGVVSPMPAQHSTYSSASE
jgi:hypothetical protein